MPIRIKINPARAMELYNLANNSALATIESLCIALGYGRTSGPIRVIDLNNVERKGLSKANFWTDSLKHPPVWGDRCCLLTILKESNPATFEIGEC